MTKAELTTQNEALKDFARTAAWTAAFDVAYALQNIARVKSQNIDSLTEYYRRNWRSAIWNLKSLRNNAKTYGLWSELHSVVRETIQRYRKP